jgi:hypothetical protein
VKAISVMLLTAIGCGCSSKQAANAAEMATNAPSVTHCVGRHAIDIPRAFSRASVTTGIFRGKGLPVQEPSIDVVVRSTGLTQTQFAAEVVRRRAELTKKTSETVDVLRLEKPLGDEATLFRVQQIDDAYISEVVFRRGESLVTATLESYRNQYIAAEDSLNKFVAAVSEQAPGIAAAPGGFCLGSVTVTGEYADEHGSFKFKAGKGNVFDIQIHGFQGDAAVPLLTRMAAPNSLLARFNVFHTVLRGGERTVAGMRAQEWLGWTGVSRILKLKLPATRGMRRKPNPASCIHAYFQLTRPFLAGSTPSPAEPGALSRGLHPEPRFPHR